MMKLQNKKIKGLAKLFMLAKNEDEIAGLIHDLFTDAEISKAHERAKIFACLMEGYSQRETQHKTRAAIATVTHGAQFLRESARVIKNILTAARHLSWWKSLFLAK